MENKRKANISKYCVACGCCLKVCPGAALTIEKGVRASVEEDKCLGCGKCAVECPAGAIAIGEEVAQ